MPPTSSNSFSYQRDETCRGGTLQFRLSDSIAKGGEVLGRSLTVGYGPESIAALKQAIASAKAADPLAPVTVVPPGNHSGLALRRSLGRDGGLVNVRFMVLARLAEFIGIGSLPAGRDRPLTDAVRVEAVRTALAAEATIFTPVAGHPSTVAAMDGAFRELAEAPPGELERLASGSARARDVVRICRRFQGLTAGYYDRPALFEAAAHGVATDPVALRDIGEVILFLPGRLGTPQVAFLESLRDASRLTAIVGLTGDETADGEHRALAQRLGADSGGASPAVPVAHRLVTATDPDEEVRTVVALILEALESGTPSSAIACYYADDTVYRALLAEQLGAAGIPFNQPSGDELTATPPGRLFVGLLRLAREGITRRALLDWLSSAPVKDGARQAPVRIWNRLSRDAGIVGGDAARWRSALDHHATELAARRDDMENLGREGAATAFERDIEQCAALATFVEALEASLRPADTLRWQQWASWSRALVARYLDARHDAGSPFEDAFDSLEAMLDDLAALDGLGAGNGVSLQAFEAAVLQAIVRPLAPSARFGHGVFLAPLELAPGIHFEASYVLGAVEGRLPGAEREDPLLSDRDRAIAPSLVQGSHRVRALRRNYLAALASATGSTVSYPEASLRIGRKQLPSRWLLESASAHEGETVDSEAFAAIRERRWLVRQVSMTARLASGLRLLTESEFNLADIRARGASPVSARHPGVSAGMALVEARRSPRFTRFDGRTVADASLVPPLASPTRLERWARCPYQHFAGDILRIAEFEEPEEIHVLSALDRGTIIHDALDAFYRETAGRGPGPWTGEERQRLASLALARCADFERLGRTGHGALWNIERTRILSDLAEFLDTDEARATEEGTSFYAAELAFGEGEGSLPPVEIPLPGGGPLQFRGRIDRVDRIADSGSYWVYDYKTGSSYGMTRLESDPLLGGQRLQLPIYAEAIRTGLHAVSVRAGYWFVSGSQGFRLREIPLGETTRERLHSVLATIRDGIEGGLFVARPGSSSANCRYCPYDALCPADRERAFERKHRDPLLEPFVALSEAPE